MTCTLPPPPAIPPPGDIYGPYQSAAGRSYYRVHGPDGYHIMWRLENESETEHRHRARAYAEALKHLKP